MERSVKTAVSERRTASQSSAALLAGPGRVQAADTTQLALDIRRSARQQAQSTLSAGIHGSPGLQAQRRQIEQLQHSRPLSMPPAQAVDGAASRPNESRGTAGIGRRQAASAANNSGLPGTLKGGMETLSGMALDDVKVHYNSGKPAQLNALAYAQGNNIHLGAGQERHLPHEAWHVVQQRQGRVQPTMQLQGTAINDNRSLEAEADVMGAKALQMGAGAAPRSMPGPARSASGRVVQRQLKLKETFTQAAPARDVTKIGLGEVVNLQSRDDGAHKHGEGVGAAQYAIESGGGALAANVYTAGAAAGTVKLSVKRADEGNVLKHKKSFQVLAPNDASMVDNGANHGTFGAVQAGAGLWGIPKLGPDTVSFSNLQWREGDGTMIANGNFAFENGNVHAIGGAHNVDAANRMIPAAGQPLGDDVRSAGVLGPWQTSSERWPIKWQYLAPGGAWKTFTTAQHHADLTSDGTVTISKKGAKKTRVLA